ncbi:MAG: hypothetical protein VW405_18495, partial [Rhodospirillaceae bacterium]
RVAEIAGRPVVLVRAERDGDRWLFSWMVAPEARGQGHGRLIVAAMVGGLGGEVRAELKAGNPASARIAAACGLHPAAEADGLQLWSMIK